MESVHKAPPLTLSLHTSDPSRTRANAITKDNMSAYFSLLEETLKDHDLLDKPSFIFNIDESGHTITSGQKELPQKV